MVRNRFHLQGGLGNQLFIYFAAASYALQHHQDKIIFDIGGLQQANTPRSLELDNFDLPIKYEFSETKIPRFGRALFSRLSLISPEFSKQIGYRRPTEVGFDPFLLERTYFEVSGYFQSWRFVDRVQKHYLDFLLKPKILSSWAVDMIAQAEQEKPILCHIRRGDYLKLSETFGALSYDYYLRAIRELRSIGVDGPVWVMTDSPEDISIEFLKSANAQLLVEPLGAPAIDGFSVMQSCKNFVISNSTYSWWAAYSSKSALVIAPEPWFKAQVEPLDLIPNSWTRIRSEWH